MALYLAQHARALSSEQDPERGISEQGRSEVVRIAGVAKNYGVRVAKIVHSGKTRAKQTAELFAEHLEPPQGVEQASGLHPQDDVSAIAMALRAEDDWMIVGHMPFVAKLASYLVIGEVEPAIFRFQNGGIVCLDEVRGTSGWIIKWALMPTVD
jgi:phosphohistidine phosphatase